MRLKTLRKERPAFENEGAVISGSRMDLSNSETKPSKQRSNTSFVFPTSLSSDLSSLAISPPETYVETMPPYHQRATHRPTPSNPTHLSSYQAIEAAYREHGIRIHLNPSTAVNISQQQTLSTENLSARKSANTIQRNRAFVNRNPSRSSSALNYSAAFQDPNENSRPFSALQPTSTVEFSSNVTHNDSYVQTTDSQNPLQINNNNSTSSIITSEHSDRIPIPTQLAITEGTTDATSSLIQNDPDLAYMSSLLKTTSGDSFRDTIRRRAGLRATFAVHRHSQLNSPPTNPKIYEKSPSTVSPTTNRRGSILRTSTIAVVPSIGTSPSKKVEKDILKHATRIRTNHLRDSFLHHPTSLRTQPNEHLTSQSSSPTRFSPQNNRTKLIKPSKSLTLEPLELILTPPLPPSPIHPSSLSTYDCSNVNKNHSQESIKIIRKRTRSPKISFVENPSTHEHISRNVLLNDQFNSLVLIDEILPLIKTSQSDFISHEQTTNQQSTLSDSGCYDHSSSSTDTHSILSSSLNQPSSTIPSARLTSASTRRSNLNKKVSFEDQSSTIIITTATYV